MIYARSVLILLIILLNTGCDKFNSIDNKTKINDAEIQILKDRMSKLENNFSKYQNDTDGSISNIYNEISENAIVSIGGDGFSIINSRLGKITVSCENITEYGSGSKVKLTFGNTTNALLNGITIKLDYGKKFVPGNDYVEWFKSVLTKQTKINEKFYPGTWANVTVSLPECKPSDLTYLSISVTIDGIQLKTGGN